MKKFLRQLFSVKNCDDRKIIRFFGLKIQIKNKKFVVNTVMNQTKELIAKQMPQPYLSRFEVHLVDHCNLNCYGCDHFSPLAEKNFANIEVFKADFERMAFLTKGQVDRILLLGGEPLLHPGLNEFLSAARKFFPNSKIELVTNGLLLTTQKEEFWQVCKDCDITVVATKYPVSFDYNKAQALATNKKVKFEYYLGTGKTLKNSYRRPLDLTGSQNPAVSFLSCWSANRCTYLENGRIYLCAVSASIKHFNKFFDKNVRLSLNDSISIYDADNIQQILDFLRKPAPFCRYCNTKEISYKKWSRSQKDISEWIVQN